MYLNEHFISKFMKTGIFTLILIQISCLGFGQKTIKRITETEYKVDEKMIKIDTLCSHFGCYRTDSYDINGKQKESTHYNKNNQVIARYIPKYQNGVFLGFEYISGNNKVIESTTNHYSKSDKLIKTEQFSFGRLNTYTIYSYNDGSLVEEIQYNGKNHSEISKILYTKYLYITN